MSEPISTFILKTLYMFLGAGKALSSLHICDGSSKHSVLTNAK